MYACRLIFWTNKIKATLFSNVRIPENIISE